MGWSPRVIEPAELCPRQPGSIIIWHALHADEARVFEELARRFEATCPGAKIDIAQAPYDEIADRFAAAARAGGGPDVLFESSRWMAPLAEEGLLLDLTERVAPRFLQQFMPNTVATMRYRGRLYGIPESVTVLALFYNNTAVSEPPIDVQMLALGVSATQRLALPVGFFWGYWGMDPFGGFTFDSYSGKILESAGLVAWLQALQHVDPMPGVELYFDFGAAEDAFAYEEAAYLVSGPWSLPRLRQTVGLDNFQVTPLPNGPVGPGSPMLQVQGTMINGNASTLAIDVALAFGQFINLPESQERFLPTESHVTASVTVDLTDYPNLESFREQAKAAALVVENSNFVLLEDLGDQLYRDVLGTGADPTVAVPAFVEAVHAATTGK
ncbi:MAG: extracellular solute-binding protein [Tetrasphaera sp.]